MDLDDDLYRDDINEEMYILNFNRFKTPCGRKKIKEEVSNAKKLQKHIDALKIEYDKRDLDGFSNQLRHLTLFIPKGDNIIQLLQKYSIFDLFLEIFNSPPSPLCLIYTIDFITRIIEGQESSLSYIIDYGILDIFGFLLHNPFENRPNIFPTFPFHIVNFFLSLYLNYPEEKQTVLCFIPLSFLFEIIEVQFLLDSNYQLKDYHLTNSIHLLYSYLKASDITSFQGSIISSQNLSDVINIFSRIISSNSSNHSLIYALQGIWYIYERDMISTEQITGTLLKHLADIIISQQGNEAIYGFYILTKVINNDYELHFLPTSPEKIINHSIYEGSTVTLEELNENERIILNDYLIEKEQYDQLSEIEQIPFSLIQFLNRIIEIFENESNKDLFVPAISFLHSTLIHLNDDFIGILLNSSQLIKAISLPIFYDPTNQPISLSLHHKFKNSLIGANYFYQYIACLFILFNRSSDHENANWYHAFTDKISGVALIRSIPYVNDEFALPIAMILKGMFIQFEGIDLSIPIQWILEEDAYTSLVDFGIEHEETYEVISQIKENFLDGYDINDFESKHSEPIGNTDQKFVSKYENEKMDRKSRMMKEIPLYPFSQEEMIRNDDNIMEMLQPSFEDMNPNHSNRNNKISEYETNKYENYELPNKDVSNENNDHLTSLNNTIPESIQMLYSNQKSLFISNPDKTSSSDVENENIQDSSDTETEYDE